MLQESQPVDDLAQDMCVLLVFSSRFFFFFFNDTATTEIYTLSYTTLFRSCSRRAGGGDPQVQFFAPPRHVGYAPLRWLRRSEEHTSELQSRRDLVCRLLLEKKKQISQKCQPRTLQS